MRAEAAFLYGLSTMLVKIKLSQCIFKNQIELDRQEVWWKVPQLLKPKRFGFKKTWAKNVPFFKLSIMVFLDSIFLSKKKEDNNTYFKDCYKN